MPKVSCGLSVLVLLVCAPALMALSASVSLQAGGQSQAQVSAGGTVDVTVVLQADAPMVGAQLMIGGNGQYFSAQGATWAEGWSMLIDLPSTAQPLPSSDMAAIAANMATGKGSGAFVTVSLKVAASTPPGSYQIEPQGAIVGDMDFELGTVSAANALTVHVVPGAAAPSLVSAVSQKAHGSEGTFAVDVSHPAAVEPRGGGPTLVVATFSDQVEASGASSVVASSGSVSSVTAAANNVTIAMSGATDGAALTLSFPGVTGANGGAAVTDSLCFNALAGDVDGDGSVTTLDLVSVRNASGQQVGQSNFANDVNADGVVNVLDLIPVRNNLNKTSAGCQ